MSEKSKIKMRPGVMWVAEHVPMTRWQAFKTELKYGVFWFLTADGREERKWRDEK